MDNTQELLTQKENLPSQIITDLAILRKNSEPIDVEEGLELAQHLIKVATATRDAFGLTAIQIGIPKRVAVIYQSMNKDLTTNWYVLINPQIYASTGSIISHEGCLSLPGQTVLTKRAATVTVFSAQLDKPITVHQLWAKAFQQEIDHMNGLLITDRAYTPETIKRNDKITISNGISTQVIKFKDLHKFNGWYITEPV